MPSRSAVFAVQPRPASRLTSSSLRGVPSGLLSSKTIRPSKPTTCITVSASSRIVTSVPVPMFASGPS